MSVSVMSIWSAWGVSYLGVGGWGMIPSVGDSGLDSVVFVLVLLILSPCHSCSVGGLWSRVLSVVHHDECGGPGVPVLWRNNQAAAVLTSRVICINGSRDTPCFAWWEYFLFASEQVCAVAEGISRSKKGRYGSSWSSALLSACECTGKTYWEHLR